MKLSMEVPIKLLKPLAPLTEYDFILAHMALENDEYAEFFRKSRKFKILDNGLHERGEPMTVQELKKAAELTNPSVVIAPDWFDDGQKTFDGFKECKRVFESKVGLGVVLWGSSPAERWHLFEAIRLDAQMLCLPFRAPRFQWFTELVAMAPRYIQWPPKLHLLGVNKLSELASFSETFHDMQMDHRVSVDTAKPIKFGLKHIRFEDGMELRGAGLLDHNAEPPKDLSDILYNIAFLRKFM